MSKSLHLIRVLKEDHLHEKELFPIKINLTDIHLSNVQSKQKVDFVFRRIQLVLPCISTSFTEFDFHFAYDGYKSHGLWSSMVMIGMYDCK